ncbi:uncharacterized protein [Ptychodera flava]|uniref:uncharacterized protein isoform X8 n=1 Tax=Ptychodera flava TaxID=63121 RepID=UPI00396A1EF4
MTSLEIMNNNSTTVRDREQHQQTSNNNTVSSDDRYTCDILFSPKECSAICKAARQFDQLRDLGKSFESLSSTLCQKNQDNTSSMSGASMIVESLVQNGHVTLEYGSLYTENDREDLIEQHDLFDNQSTVDKDSFSLSESHLNNDENNSQNALVQKSKKRTQDAVQVDKSKRSCPGTEADNSKKTNHKPGTDSCSTNDQSKVHTGQMKKDNFAIASTATDNRRTNQSPTIADVVYQKPNYKARLSRAEIEAFEYIMEVFSPMDEQTRDDPPVPVQIIANLQSTEEPTQDKQSNHFTENQPVAVTDGPPVPIALSENPQLIQDAPFQNLPIEGSENTGPVPQQSWFNLMNRVANSLEAFIEINRNRCKCATGTRQEVCPPMRPYEHIHERPQPSTQQQHQVLPWQQHMQQQPMQCQAGLAQYPRQRQKHQSQRQQHQHMDEYQNRNDCTSYQPQQQEEQNASDTNSENSLSQLPPIPKSDRYSDESEDCQQNHTCQRNQPLPRQLQQHPRIDKSQNRNGCISHRPQLNNEDQQTNILYYLATIRYMQQHGQYQQQQKKQQQNLQQQEEQNKNDTNSEDSIPPFPPTKTFDQYSDGSDDCQQNPTQPQQYQSLPRQSQQHPCPDCAHQNDSRSQGQLPVERRHPGQLAINDPHHKQNNNIRQSISNNTVQQERQHTGLVGGEVTLSMRQECRLTADKPHHMVKQLVWKLFSKEERLGKCVKGSDKKNNAKEVLCPQRMGAIKRAVLMDFAVSPSEADRVWKTQVVESVNKSLRSELSQWKKRRMQQRAPKM